MDVDLKMNFRRRGAHIKGMRKAQAFRIKLGRKNIPRVGSVIFNVWFACQ